MSYSFRIRFYLPERDTIGIKTSEIILGKYAGYDLVLRSRNESIPIEKSDHLVVISNGYTHEDKAREAGIHCMDALRRTCARIHIGADFGERSPRSGFTTYGLEWIKGQSGFPTLNDEHGLMIYKKETELHFALVNHPNVLLTHSQDLFIKVLDEAIKISIDMSDQERLAFCFYSSSYFQKSIDASFMMLMISLEILIEPIIRDQRCQDYIDLLINQTNETTLLLEADKSSLVGSLAGLRSESIGQAGRKLAEKLGFLKYGGEEPAQFFTRCYTLRSRLVHGSKPYPTRDEIAAVSNNLQQFVSDLLSGPLVESSDQVH